MRNSKPLRQLMYIKYKRTHPKFQSEIYSTVELKIPQCTQGCFRLPNTMPAAGGAIASLSVL
ncbi:MAG: hypothetical protein V7L09_29310 [Nostoc sp.]|uniref:hypothetical protein n=1 Tax=Nostoc sp. TaxID=1180 RepID=UPI002FEFC125